MNRIPPSFIQEVIARSDIVEIIRSRVKLTQRGDNYLAHCPFHEEKTPSFNVSHSKQFYYCFGCSANGNVIGFLMAFDRMEFREAITHLAAHTGLEMPASTTDEDAKRYQALYQVLDNAAKYYCMSLRRHPAAIDYVKSRGLSERTAQHFSLGYAPAGWDNLQKQMGASPEQQTALAESGLIINKKPGRTYDHFRDRIMFPIRNVTGQIIGFGGRTRGDDQPKYLNSPETLLFHKGQELYGLYEARQHSKKLTQLIVVEGYMDVIALHQQGITNAVATLGTAITTKQVQKCLRYVNHCVFCFDGDPAGRQAAWKALTLALPLLRENIHIHFLFLPDREDPDSLVRKIGAVAFSQLLEQSRALPDVFFEALRQQIPVDSLTHKAHFGQQAARYLNTIPQGLFRQLMYDRLAEELQVEASTLSELLQPPLPQSATTQPRTPKPSGRGRQLLPPTHRAISLLLHNSSLAELAPNTIELDLLDDPEKNLFIRILHCLREQPQLTTGELLTYLNDAQEQQLIAELATRSPTVPLEGMKTEFMGVMAIIKRRARDHSVNQLIEKAKKSELNLEEKRKLQTLLATIREDDNPR